MTFDWVSTTISTEYTEITRSTKVFINRRVLIIIGVATVVLVGAISFTLAFAFSHVNANQGSAASDTPTVVPPVTTQKTGNRACPLGVIQSLGNQSFVVSANQGKRNITVNVNENKVYVEGGSRVNFSITNLEGGERVSVTENDPGGRQSEIFLPHTKSEDHAANSINQT